MNEIIKIKGQIIDEILSHARADSPIEACGYLAGSKDLISCAYPLTNIDKSTEHFSFLPEEQFGVLRQARNEGLEIIGVYHSHPQTPARPSPEDIKLAFDQELIYIIVSLVAEVLQAVRAFRIIEGKVIEAEISVV